MQTIHNFFSLNRTSQTIITMKQIVSKLYTSYLPLVVVMKSLLLDSALHDGEIAVDEQSVMDVPAIGK